MPKTNASEVGKDCHSGSYFEACKVEHLVFQKNLGILEQRLFTIKQANPCV